MTDRGLTWEESFDFKEKTDVRVAYVGNDILLAGTTTHWLPIPSDVKEATGDLYTSTDGGRTFAGHSEISRRNETFIVSTRSRLNPMA